MQTKKQITQYFSKWQKCWVYFTNNLGNKYNPNKAEIKEYLKFKYQLR